MKIIFIEGMMRRFFSIVLICFFIVQLQADAFFIKKKDYKQNFLNNAISAEKRNDNKAAFHSYEKALYYYKKDAKVIEAYAKFCERQKYYEKAEALYQRLYVLTKDKKYIFKSNLNSIINGKMSNEQLNKLSKTSGLSASQRIELNSALANHYAYDNDWKSVSATCEKIPIKGVGRDVITSCIIANEKLGNKKNALKYYMRFSDMNPKDSSAAAKAINTAEALGDYSVMEIYTKRLMSLNPSDNGIKYKLAGIYERQKKWQKAAKVYEALMILGDKSEHVKTSHAYVLSQLNPKTASSQKVDNGQKQDYTYSKPKPRVLTERERKENELYSALRAKKYEKTLDIAEELLKKYPDDKKYLVLALENSMAIQNWDKAQVYNERLLLLSPTNELLLKNRGDLYSIKKDFSNAITSYQALVEKYPKGEYLFALANLYMANQEFSKAQEAIFPLYEATPQNPKAVDLYLNSLLAQQKIKDAYWVIKEHKLENTKEGYMVLGDMAMMDKEYKLASQKYRRALDLEPDSMIYKNKLAEAYRALGCRNSSEALFREVLQKDPKNREARLGIGSLQTDMRNYDASCAIFYSLLEEDPSYRPARIGIAHSYIASDYKLNALKVLNQLSPDDETEMLKGQIYYDLNMWSDSKDEINDVYTKDSKELKYKIRRDEAITITPGYSFMIQTLAENFKLDADKFTLHMAKNIDNNTNVFMDYNVIWYQSSGTTGLSNVVNEFVGGAKSRVNEKWEYRADVGVKAFQYGGGMIISDSWLKHYFSDKFNMKLGYYRNNIEQSFLSAVGQYVNGIYTGRSANNRFYLEFEGKLPNEFYYYGRGVYGLVCSQNLDANQYSEGMIGAGRLFYNNPKNPWVNRVGFDVVSFNTTYQYDQLKIYDSTGKLFGGYFSPSYFNATTGNVKVEGDIKRWRLKYGVTAFGGIQTSMSPDQTTPTWGVSPYISYDINENVTFNASYAHFTYADIMRDIFMVNAVIRGFRSGKK